MTLEQQARKRIDELLVAAGWSVQDVKAADIHAARGVAIREFPLERRAAWSACVRRRALLTSVKELRAGNR